MNNITCTVSWCGNKCHLYNKSVESYLSYVLISSLRTDGYCEYRPTTSYVYESIAIENQYNKLTGF